MLHNLEWLKQGEVFPPACESARLERYKQNAALFDGDHFASTAYRHIHGCDNIPVVEIYRLCASRISRVIGNFEDIVSFATLLNYQRMMSLKMADLVCGESPNITGGDKEQNDELKRVRDYTDFDSKLYAAVIDVSRYGDAVQRMYFDSQGNKTFTNWDPTEWFPIVSQDGTNTITHHVLCWKENRSKDAYNQDWYLHVQIHPVDLAGGKGYYYYRVFKMHALTGAIGVRLSSAKIETGFDVCAIQHLRSFSVSNSVYGYDDYLQIDSLLAEIMTRVGQISVILDKHADPNITGPVSMLDVDARGEYHLKTGKFYAVSPGEDHPEYMVWEGQLTAAFKQLELLINQLYILSEMGAALLGGQDGSSQAISGTAMRFKMVNPLAKARRISNALTRPVRALFSTLSEDLKFENISVFWADGLPDDPRENAELVKLLTGATELMPLENAIAEYFGRSNEEALTWIDKIKSQKEEALKMAMSQEDPNKSGPQDGTGVNPRKKGSNTGLKSFHGINNK